MADVSGADLLRTIALLPQPAGVIQADTLDAAPAGKGAYLLLMHFPAPVDFSHKGAARRLGAGWYAYAGSAYGPGGIRARLRRHFRRDKKRHWHVDHLTVQAQEIVAAAVEGGSECTIAEGLIESGVFQTALAGFGSSDCASCPAHLLVWQG